jgi:Bacterial membrane protein YfhO
MERGRRAIWIDRFMFGLLAVFVVATLGQALIGGVTLLDVNLLTRFAPWESLHGQDILTTNICRGDTVDNVMPAIAQTRSQFFRGDFPGWSSTLVGGFPLAGLPNFGAFSPLALPYYVLPLWLAPAFVKLGEFAIAIGGMTLFLRRLRLSVAAGILAGIVFASSGFMISWTNWPQTRVAAFIPALLWATERLVQRQRALDALPLAAIVASMLLGGFPAVTGLALYCAALYFLVRIVLVHGSRWKTSVRATLLAALGLTLGAALSFFQLLPFARSLSLTNLDYRAQGPNDHSMLSSLITTMVPGAQGLCINGASTSRDTPIENVAFIGVAAIVLGLVAILISARKVQRTQRGVVGFLGVAVVVVVFLGWVGGPLLSVAQHLPVFSNNSVSRIRALLGFLVAALAGFGFEGLLRVVRDRDRHGDGDPNDSRPPAGGSDDADDRPDEVDDQPDEAAATVDGPVPSPSRSRFGLVRFRLRSVVVLTVTTFFALLVLKDAISEALANESILHLAKLGVIPAILLVICVASVLAVASGPRWMRYIAIVAISLIAVGQSASAFRASVPGSNPDNFYPVTSTHQFLQQNLGSDRFASSDFRMYPSTSTYYGLRTPTGHRIATGAWTALLHAVDPHSSVSPTNSDFTAGALNAGTAGHLPILDQMAVRYFVAAAADIAGTKVDPPPSSATVTPASEQHARCSPLSGPLRAVTVNVAGPLRRAGPAGVTVHVTMHTPRGDLTGARYLPGGLGAATSVSVAIPGEDLTTADPVTADVWVSGVSGAFALRSNGAAVSCGKVVPIPDGLKLVSSADGLIVYQRLSSLPRIRWASASSVQTDPAARVAQLKAGISPDAVVLNTAGPVASGKPATVRLTRDDGDTVAATVDAAGAGYLVVADSLQQPGWSATVDGRPATLLPANNAMVAVPVSAGVHRVELSYTVPGQRTGAVVTGGAFLVCLGIVALWWRRRSERGAAPELPDRW